ncbi:unnamed protein product [Schistocephalus solidus]|uniref:COesterase domain-containing protein n=1 Tax=Schistocephalus solidus TaxID=70667 RepID=A0A183SDA4_SCHSO|nr:unnamed protein product [Schistocephalus solidus]
MWVRYVNATFVIIKASEVEQFHQSLNSGFLAIQFTREEATGGIFSFLDPTTWDAITEHKLAIRQCDPLSLVFAHALELDHRFNWDGTDVVARAYTKQVREFLEAWHSSTTSINRHVDLDSHYEGLLFLLVVPKIPTRLLDLIGCGGRSGEDLHACLQLKPSSAFIDAQNSLYDPYAYLSIPFRPVLDGHFLPYNSSQSFRELEFLKPSGSLMMGMNTNEGSYFLLYAFVGNETLMKDRNALPVRTHTEYLKALYRVLDMHGVDRPDLLEPLIALTDFEYQDYTHLPGPTTWTNKLEKISSDRSFKCPTIDFARVIVNEQRAVHKHPNKRSVTRPTYFYEFTHRTKSLPWPTWAGVMHGYEIEYVFGIPFSPLFNEAFYGFTDEERELSDVMMTYWANFARTGDPNILATGDHVADASGSELAVPDKVTAPSGRSWVLNGFERPKDAPLLAVGGSQSCLPHRLPLRNWQEFDNRTEAFLILAAGRDGLRTGIHPPRNSCRRRSLSKNYNNTAFYLLQRLTQL